MCVRVFVQDPETKEYPNNSGLLLHVSTIFTAETLFHLSRSVKFARVKSNHSRRFYLLLQIYSESDIYSFCIIMNYLLEIGGSRRSGMWHYGPSLHQRNLPSWCCDADADKRWYDIATLENKVDKDNSVNNTRMPFIIMMSRLEESKYF